LRVRAHKIGSNGMNATSRSGKEVDRALASVKRALAQLINLLTHPDVAVRSGAAAALKELDPPPTWPLGEALLGSRDTEFRLRIIKVLAALAALDQLRVVFILCEAFKHRRYVEVKWGVSNDLRDPRCNHCRGDGFTITKRGWGEPPST
jgi:HEAT repeat protein